MSLKITSLKLLMSRAYLIESEDRLILVDAGLPGEERRIVGAMKALGAKRLDLIFITHAHIDHYGSAAAIREITGAPIAIHKADAEPMAMGETRLGTAKGRGKLVSRLLPLVQRIRPVPPTEADILFEDVDDFSDQGLAAQALHTPGHTLGSASLLVGDEAFVGDLLTTTANHPRLQRSGHG